MAGEVVPLKEAKPSPLEAFVEVQNCVDQLEPDVLSKIGDKAVREYKLDKDSMKDWRGRMDRGIDLATLIKGEKDYPFPKAANVKYPLITSAALQFNAKAYPAIVQNDQVVRTRVFGSDPQGAKAARGQRVSSHMSWQLTSQIEEWEEIIDKLLVQLPIVGTMIKKVWHDPAWGRIRNRLIAPGKFIVNDRVTSLEDSPRCTEELELYPDEITERISTGTFADIDYIEAPSEDSEEPEAFIEQHRKLDLDGDGYGEPYIVTVHLNTRKVARIVADYEMKDVVTGDKGKVLSIRRSSYYVAYHFLPSLDGGFHGTGLGLLLGDISETINSIINQMLDAGHMASLGGGFIGSEFRIKGGSQRFRPGEWKLVSQSGDDIRKGMVPLTFPSADKTLFELLGLLIDAGKDISSVKDVLTGETQGMANMPATTALALIEQGMAQFTAAYKRIFRSLKAEYRLIAKINKTTVSPEEYNRFHDEMEPVPMPPQMMGAPSDGQVTPGDSQVTPGVTDPAMAQQMPPQMQPKLFDPATEYDLSDMDIVPVADPNNVSRMQEAAKAQALGEMAKEGLVNPQEASKRMLEALSIPDIEELAPQPDPMMQQMAQLQAALLQAQGEKEQAQAQLAMAQSQQIMIEAQQAPEVPPDTAPLEFEKIASTERQTAAKLASEAEAKAADAHKKRVEAQVLVEELRLKEQELALKAQDLQIREAETALKGHALNLDAKKTDAEIQRGERETGLNERRTAAEMSQGERKLAMEHERGSRELGLGERAAALNEKKTERELKQADRGLDQGDRKIDTEHERGNKQIAVTEKKNKADAKAAGIEPDEPKKPKKTRTRVTEHDDKGRIVAFEQEELE